MCAIAVYHLYESLRWLSNCINSPNRQFPCTVWIEFSCTFYLLWISLEINSWQYMDLGHSSPSKLFMNITPFPSKYLSPKSLAPSNQISLWSQEHRFDDEKNKFPWKFTLIPDVYCVQAYPEYFFFIWLRFFFQFHIRFIL